MTRIEFSWENGRGQQLHGVEFVPQGAHWANLVWNHGVCEHSGRYTPVFEHLAAAGVAVYSFDVHGHGRSQPTEPGERGLIRDYNHLVDDLYTFVSVVENTRGHGRLPTECTFLAGQSMGGLVAALAALRCQERWAGLVVFSGAMGVVWTPVLRAQALVGNLLAALIPRQQLVPAVVPEKLHPDPAVVDAFKQDPLVFHGNLRAMTGNQLLKAINHLAASRAALTLPIYAVHGTRDAVTSLQAIEAFTSGVSSVDLCLVKVEGGYHEMLMGEERVASADALLAWMRVRAGAASRGSNGNMDGGGATPARL